MAGERVSVVSTRERREARLSLVQQAEQRLGASDPAPELGRAVACARGEVRGQRVAGPAQREREVPATAGELLAVGVMAGGEGEQTVGVDEPQRPFGAIGRHSRLVGGSGSLARACDGLEIVQQ